LVDALPERDVPVASRLLEALLQTAEPAERAFPATAFETEIRGEPPQGQDEARSRRLILDLAGSGLWEGNLSEMREDALPGKARPDSR
jgi:hypothetical protein